VRSGLEWRLEELNLSLGPVNKGDLVLVAARPEVGKTTFLTSEISYMLSQTEGDVLWFAKRRSWHQGTVAYHPGYHWHDHKRYHR